MAAPRNVDQYIRDAPAPARPVLRKVRAAIRRAAPEAEESIGYGMPFYSYRGETGIGRRLCYFGLEGAGLGLFLRPMDLEPHSQEIAPYRRTKSALRFALEESIPIRLIQKLVRDADRRHRASRRT
jgi:uncharacterized protein YdhG (YjbR/CyaY superfamily)